MGASSLIKVSLVSLAIVITLFNTPATSTPIPTEQAKDNKNLISPLQKCLESLNLRGSEKDQRSNSLGNSDSTSTELPQASFSKECETVLGEFIASADTGAREKVVDFPFISSFSSSALSEKTPTQTLAENRNGNNALKPVSPAEGENLPAEALARQEEPLNRQSRDIRSADKEMLLGAHGVASRLLARGDLVRAAQNQGTSHGVSGDALLLKLAKNRLLAELSKNLLQTNRRMGIEDFIKSISQNPSVAFGSSVSQELKPADDRDIVNALTIDSGVDEEDTHFTQSRGSSENSDYSSRGIKRASNTLSVNNAMMAITNMLLAEQKERLQRNRQRIRQHMLIQG